MKILFTCFFLYVFFFAPYKTSQSATCGSQAIGQKSFQRLACCLALLQTLARVVLPIFSEKQRGGENSGEGKTYHKSAPQKRFWTPPLMVRFPPPPPLCSRNVILLRGNGHRPDKSHFLRPPKLVLEGVLYGTFPPPPPKSHDTFPPPLRIPKFCEGV